MRLYLLRHADTAGSKKDASSELSTKGIASIKHLVDSLDNKEISHITEIRHSPSAEAQQSAQIFKKKARIKAKLREVPLLRPHDDYRILADILESGDKDMLVVGHQPNLGMLASYLLSRDSQQSLVEIKKSGLLCLEMADGVKNDPGSKPEWKLLWSAFPKLIRQQ